MLKLTELIAFTSILFLIFFCDSVTPLLPQAHQEGVLRPYKSYADVTLFHYYVPEQANVATFEFAAFMDNGKCNVRQAFIYIQHGSYPVFNQPDNATFPPDFFVNRTSIHKVVVKSNFKTHDASVLPVYNPLPGNWFAAAYLNTWNEKVQQEGIGHKCRYSLGSVGLWSLTPDVVTLPLKSTMRLTSSRHFSYFKFYIPSGVATFSIVIDDCRFLTNRRFRDSKTIFPDGTYNETQAREIKCIENIFMRDRALPFYNGNQANVFVTGSPNSNFTLVEKLPWTDSYYYLLVVAESRVTFNLTILVEECPEITLSKSLLQQFSGILNSSTSTPKDQILQVNMSVMSNSSSSGHVLVNKITSGGMLPQLHYPFHQCPCVPTFRLMRIRHAQDFSDTFLLEGKDWFTTWLALTDVTPVVGTSFSLLPFIDIGGTLSISVHLDELIMNATTQTVHVNVCVNQGRRPRTYCCDYSKENPVSCCDTGINLQVSSKNLTEVNDAISIPFPEAGVYYMSFKMHCEFDGNVVPCAVPEALISLDIRTQPCVHRSRSPQGPPVSTCGSYGFCQEVHKGQYFYTACRCVAGYKGWACNDDSEATPKSVLLMTTLLLTLSNIFFIPAIVLALTRRMFVQALVYFCTMLSSALYHACDQELYGYCLTRYSVLQFCDFFCSILAFWVTIIALNRTEHEYDSVLYVFGAVLIAIGVEYNRTGLLVFVLPFAIGLAYILSAWGYRSYKRRAIIIPKVGRLLLFLPGVFLGASGLILFAFVETIENYRYTHSAWHCVIALSLLYLLPKRRTIKMQLLTNTTSIASVAMAPVNPDYQPTSASPVFFITSELDHLVVQDRPQ